MKVLGEHTAVSIAKRTGLWKEIQYLKENGGKLPPNIIVMGDRRRVDSGLLGPNLLSEGIRIDEEIQKKGKNSDQGRVNLAVGIFEYSGKILPLTLLETQMGMPAQDIIAWEILANTKADGYKIGNFYIRSKGINIIRAGTCGAIILKNKDGQQEEPSIDIGNIIVGTGSIGDGATVRQRLGCISSFDGQDMRRFKRIWKELGYSFTLGKLWPKIDSSPEVTSALINACARIGLTWKKGWNFTKESLYMETDEEQMRDLRRKYGVLSTEMEHFGLAFLADEMTRNGTITRNGLISTVVGTIPGGSFAAPDSDEEEVAKSKEFFMLKAATYALWNLRYAFEV